MTRDGAVKGGHLAGDEATLGWNGAQLISALRGQAYYDEQKGYEVKSGIKYDNLIDVLHNGEVTNPVTGKTVNGNQQYIDGIRKKHSGKASANYELKKLLYNRVRQ